MVVCFVCLLIFGVGVVCFFCCFLVRPFLFVCVRLFVLAWWLFVCVRLFILAWLLFVCFCQFVFVWLVGRLLLESIHSPLSRCPHAHRHALTQPLCPHPHTLSVVQSYALGLNVMPSPSPLCPCPHTAAAIPLSSSLCPYHPYLYTLAFTVIVIPSLAIMPSPLFNMTSPS